MPTTSSPYSRRELSACPTTIDAARMRVLNMAQPPEKGNETVAAGPIVPDPKRKSYDPEAARGGA